jgi:hypothetical protein
MHYLAEHPTLQALYVAKQKLIRFTLLKNRPQCEGEAAELS